MDKLDDSLSVDKDDAGVSVFLDVLTFHLAFASCDVDWPSQIDRVDLWPACLRKVDVLPIKDGLRLSIKC